MNVMFCTACNGPVVIVAFIVLTAHTINAKLVCPACKERGFPFEGEIILDLREFPTEGEKPYEPGGYL